MIIQKMIPKGIITWQKDLEGNWWRRASSGPTAEVWMQYGRQRRTFTFDANGVYWEQDSDGMLWQWTKWRGWEKFEADGNWA